MLGLGIGSVGIGSVKLVIQLLHPPPNFFLLQVECHRPKLIDELALDLSVSKAEGEQAEGGSRSVAARLGWLWLGGSGIGLQSS